MASIFTYQRGIQALLSVLMGDHSSGHLMVAATSAPVVLPCGSVAVPIDDGDFAEHAAVFVTKNPSREDGGWVVDSGGTLVPVESIQGGPVTNHAEGDSFRWFPAIDGVAETASAAVAIAGGARRDVFAELQSMRLVKMMAPEDWKTFLRAQLGTFPAAALTWDGLAPVDGPNFVPGNRTARVGAHGIKYRHDWSLYLVTSRVDSATHRTAESMVLMQNVLEELQGRTSGRGLRISNDPGIQIVRVNTRSATPTSFIDVVRFQTTIVSRDKTTAVGNPWLRTRLVAKTDVLDDDRPALENPDIIIDMVFPGDEE